MKLRSNWYLEDSVPWYQPPGGGWRVRGIVRVCRTCDEEFPALKDNPGLYCSKACLGRATGGSNRATRLDLFERWTPEECWLAGLLWTDGTLAKRENRTNCWRLQLSMTDEDAVTAAAQVAGCAYRTLQRPAPRKAIHRMQIGEHCAVERIATLGMAEPKLGKRPWPDLPHPDAFLRGAFDGDGCASSHIHRYQKNGKRYVGVTPVFRTQICGNRTFLEGLQGFLAPEGIAPKAIHRYPKKPLCYIEWSVDDSFRLAGIMYADGGPCIERKRVIFEAARAARLGRLDGWGNWGNQIKAGE